MTTFKEKKKAFVKKKPEFEFTTIDSRHNEIIKSYNDELKNIPELEKELEQLKDKYNYYSNIQNNQLSEDQLEDKLCLKEKIIDCENTIKNIKDHDSLNKYLLQTSHLLFNYFESSNKQIEQPIIPTSIKSSKKSIIDYFYSHSDDINISDTSNNSYPVISNPDNLSRNQIIENYLSIVENNYIKKTYEQSLEDLDKCKICNNNRIFNTINSVYICPECGIEEKVLYVSDSHSFKEPPREITYFAYKKINHFKEWLSQFQAKESTNINDDVLDKIKNELKKESYLKMENIQASKILEILRKLNLTKFYEHCHYITNRLTGNPAPIIDHDLEEKLLFMFKEIQGPWLMYCPKNRSNLLSYPWLFFKFFQILDRHEFLPYLRLLKCREKIIEHDEVWKKICTHLGWKYYDTPLDFSLVINNTSPPSFAENKLNDNVWHGFLHDS